MSRFTTDMASRSIRASAVNAPTIAKPIVTTRLVGGFMEKMKPSLDSRAIRIVGEQFVDSWRPEGAKVIMQQILTARRNKVDAVMVMNDGMASGVSKALEEQNLSIPISGQDGAGGALNRIARAQ